jgi:hypothetical protein
MPDKITDPKTSQSWTVIAEWRQEDAPGVMASTIYEVVAGPKRYARRWDSLPDRIEWGWVLNDAAHLVKSVSQS